MANVFISHRGDHALAAERLAADLRAHRHRVWIDLWEIRVGDSITIRLLKERRAALIAAAVTGHIDVGAAA